MHTFLLSYNYTREHINKRRRSTQVEYHSASLNTFLLSYNYIHYYVIYKHTLSLYVFLFIQYNCVWYSIITYIIILYKQKKIQSKYKVKVPLLTLPLVSFLILLPLRLLLLMCSLSYVKVPLLTLIFKSFLCIVRYLSRRCFKRPIRNTLGTH